MIKRVRYFAGQLLGADDFEAEQRYVIERFRRLNRWLHGWGIVGGLRVSVSPGEIVVSPGLALDCHGNEIELDRPASVALPAGGKASYLTVAFTERAVADFRPATCATKARFGSPSSSNSTIRYTPTPMSAMRKKIRVSPA